MPNEAGMLLKTKGRFWEFPERTRNVSENKRHTKYFRNVAENKKVILKFEPQKPA
jgi:hypothetical protein